MPWGTGSRLPARASLALQSGAPAEERAHRLGLKARISNLQAQFALEHPDALSGETDAWQALIEAYAGICAIHAMVADPEKAHGLQGSRTASDKAFHASLKGIQVAFPEPMALEEITKALQVAAAACTEAVLKDLGEEENLGDHAAAGLKIHREVLQALQAEAGLLVTES